MELGGKITASKPHALRQTATARRLSQTNMVTFPTQEDGAMSATSAIEWTDATWNPVRGCTKISPGCKHCYAETFAERFRGVPAIPMSRDSTWAGAAEAVRAAEVVDAEDDLRQLDERLVPEQASRIPSSNRSGASCRWPTGTPIRC